MLKSSRSRPGVAQRVPRGLGTQILMTFGTWRRWVRQPHAPAAFTPEMFLELIITRGWVDPRIMVRSEGNMLLKNPVTTPGIDPWTVRLVAQRFNYYATSAPYIYILYVLKIYTNLCNLPDLYGCDTSTSLLSTDSKVHAGPWRPSRSISGCL